MSEKLKNPVVKNFTSFYEQKDITVDHSIVIVHVQEKLSHSVQRLIEECKKQKIKFYLCNVDGAYIEDGFLYRGKDDRGFKLSDNVVSIILGDVHQKDSYLNFLSELERTGCTLVNSRRTIEVCSDKYRTYLNLKRADISQPKTVLIPNKDAAEDALEKLDTKFPIILKTTKGSKGIGVIFIESERSYNATVQLLFKTIVLISPSVFIYS